MDIYATFKQIDLTLGFPGATVVKNPPASAGDARLSSVAGLKRPAGGGNGNPLQYSYLENSTEEPGRLQSMGSQRIGRNRVRMQATLIIGR